MALRPPNYLPFVWKSILIMQECLTKHTSCPLPRPPDRLATKWKKKFSSFTVLVDPAACAINSSPHQELVPCTRPPCIFPAIRPEYIVSVGTENSGTWFHPLPPISDPHLHPAKLKPANLPCQDSPPTLQLQAATLISLFGC